MAEAFDNYRRRADFLLVELECRGNAGNREEASSGAFDTVVVCWFHRESVVVCCFGIYQGVVGSRVWQARKLKPHSFFMSSGACESQDHGPEVHVAA